MQARNHHLVEENPDEPLSDERPASLEEQRVAIVDFEQLLRSPTLKALYFYWRNLRGDRLAPARAEVDPSQIVSVLPDLGLFDIEENPRRYRIRLIGTRIVSWYGCDLTGRYLDEIDFGISDSFTFAILDGVVDNMAPGYMSGEYTKQDGRTIRYERIYMPLSNDGAHANMVIGAAVRLPPDTPITGDCLDLPSGPVIADPGSVSGRNR